MGAALRTPARAGAPIGVDPVLTTVFPGVVVRAQTSTVFVLVCAPEQVPLNELEEEQLLVIAKATWPLMKVKQNTIAPPNRSFRQPTFHSIQFLGLILL